MTATSEERKIKRRKYSLDYYYRNKEKCSERNKGYYENNTEHIKEYRERNKDRRKELTAKWGRSNRERILLNSARHRAKRQRIEFTISLEDIVIPEVCPVLGVPFSKEEKRGPLTPSLDRIDNTKGYIPGNIWVISWRINELKRDATLEELKRLIVAIEHYVHTSAKTLRASR